MTATNLLTPGDEFPALTLNLLGGDTLELPLADGYTVVLLYRGAWCPYCNAQLRAFERAQGKLAEVGARVVALSIDDEATTQATDRQARARRTLSATAQTPARRGSDRRTRESRRRLPGVDRLRRKRRSGKVAVSVYSSNAIGRLVPDDVLGFIRYMREHEPAAT